MINVNTSIFGMEVGKEEGVARPQAEPGWCYHVPYRNYFILLTELYILIYCVLYIIEYTLL